MSDADLQDVARQAGIAVEWQDNTGHPHVVAADVLRRILAALGLPANTDADITASRSSLVSHATVADLPPLITATAGQATDLDVRPGRAGATQLMLEQGEARDLALIEAEDRLQIPPISEIGYHRLEIGSRQVVLAVAPPKCRTVEDVAPGERLWGLAAQVYGLRSKGDGGIGHAGGIADLAESAAAHGADAIALSPLHALFSANPAHFAPYSPSSRLFLNPMHAAPALVFGEARVGHAVQRAGLGELFTRLETDELIDWPVAAEAKRVLLPTLFDEFVDGPDMDGRLGADFARFRADGGPLLAQHTCFEALHAARWPDHDWRQWPTDLRDPGSPTVAAFADAHRREVLFHMFLQWVTDRSLGIAQERARAAGMRIGLISDLAVGMVATGSHAWGSQSDLLLGLTVGAPPDLFNPRGQAWGLTGFSPRALVSSGFAPFIATLRAALRHAGGVRIDHAMGLARLWLLPDGADPGDGAYIAYPATDLIRLLALESVRHDAVVIGEDLGTVPEGFRDVLAGSGVLGMRVLFFERDWQQNFIPPGAWDLAAVAMTSTHDLPTVAGWWRGSDITVRAEHGCLGVGVTKEHAQAEREGDRPRLWQALCAEGLAEGPQPKVASSVVDSALRFVARSPSPLCLIPVEDVLGQEEQPNLPGTIDEHPNWRRRMPRLAADLLAEEPAKARVAALAGERPKI